jgi:hypothetical protein
MKLLFENWRRYLKEELAPSEDPRRRAYEEASEDKKELIRTIYALESHVSKVGNSLHYLDAKFLTDTTDPGVVKHSGLAYRGVRLRDLVDLLGMLDDPSYGKLDYTYIFRGEIPWFNGPMLEAIKNPGKWVDIIPPSDIKLVGSKYTQNITSFTKSFERVKVFASGVDEESGAFTTDRNPNLEVIFVAKGEPPFIDVNETLAKHKTWPSELTLSGYQTYPEGRQFEPEYPHDVEVLSIGDRTIDKILIKIKPGAEDEYVVQDMLRWIEMANQKEKQNQA